MSENRRTFAPYLADYLRKERKKLNMSQQKMAEKIGVSQSSIYKYENAKNVPTDEVLAKYSEILDVPIEFLLELRHKSAIEGKNSQLTFGFEVSELSNMYKYSVDRKYILKEVDGESLTQDELEKAIEFIRFIRKMSKDKNS